MQDCLHHCQELVERALQASSEQQQLGGASSPVPYAGSMEASSSSSSAPGAQPGTPVTKDPQLQLQPATPTDVTEIVI